MSKQNEKNLSPVMVNEKRVYTFGLFKGPKALKNILLKTAAENMKIVFYNSDDKYPVKGFRDIICRKNKTHGNLFFAINATKYGALVPKDATHMAVAVFGKSVIQKLYELKIPEPYSKIIVSLDEATSFVMTIRRSAKNIFVTFGDNNHRGAKANDERVNKKHEQINQKWIQLSRETVINE